ncbi:MAG: exodeoxyribonuclease VII large subunit [Myxococcales bacterium]|nr:exodeoxyribonuclease VII large subunit [Myxococcales bacterium]
MHSRLRKLLQPALDAKPFWIRAELSSVSGSGGRLYCDLVELKDGRVVAKLRCTIWPRELKLIRQRLADARLDDLLDDGNEVGLRCHIQYHDLYGMSVTAVDVDPAESLGALERKRIEIVERLRKEKLLEKNSRHSVPALPRRIGLVASRDTAGYKDFVTTIAASGYAITIFAADARVEGDSTESSVLRALGQLEKLDLDLVVLLRGGGSRVSLSYMDNEAIARAIADYKYPVWTAIGHEIDTSVLDAVAHTSFKTPTAVGENLVTRYSQADEKLQSARRDLRRLVQLRLRPERDRIDGSGELLVSFTRRVLRERKAESQSHAHRFRLLVQKRLSTEDGRLRRSKMELESLARQCSSVAFRALLEHRKSLNKTVGRALASRVDTKDRLVERLLSPVVFNRLRSEGQRTAAWKQILRAADPARNLERGYALVYDSEGTLLRSIHSVAKGQAIRTELADGTVQSSVDSVMEKADE